MVGKYNVKINREVLKLVDVIIIPLILPKESNDRADYLFFTRKMDSLGKGSRLVRKNFYPFGAI